MCCLVRRGNSNCRQQRLLASLHVDSKVVTQVNGQREALLDSSNDQFNFLHGGNRFYTRFIPPECTDRQGNFFSGLLEEARSTLGQDDGHLHFHPARFLCRRAKNGEILRGIGGNVYICSPFRGFPAGPGIDGAVAQSVEQWTENPCVGGSIPPHTTNNRPGNSVGFCFCLFNRLFITSGGATQS